MSKLAINVTTPDGRCGPWSIETLEVDSLTAHCFNLRVQSRGAKDHHLVTPGIYKLLRHKSRGVVMSNTPMEVLTNLAFINSAKGNVLINGLGLGMLLTALMGKPSISKITVVEIDKDVIALTAPHFREHIGSGRLTIVHSDCFNYRPPKGEKYDVIWHDIWDDITDENLFEMRTLRKLYRKVAKRQLFWAEADCREIRNRYDQICRKFGKTYAEFRKFLKERGDI